jgi:hypothetical protein
MAVEWSLVGASLVVILILCAIDHSLKRIANALETEKREKLRAVPTSRNTGGSYIEDM